MRWYYFVIRYLPNHVDEALLAGRCIVNLHHHLYRQEINNIGVSFPEWSHESLGKCIAFFTLEEDALFWLRESRYFQIMEEADLFERGEIQAIEQDDSSGVVFVRNQQIGKLTPASKARRLKRSKKRAEQRGEVYSPNNVEQEREIDHYHWIPIESTSSQRAFTLFVQCYELPAIHSMEALFNSYGLSGKEASPIILPKI